MIKLETLKELFICSGGKEKEFDNEIWNVWKKTTLKNNPTFLCQEQYVDIFGTPELKVKYLYHKPAPASLAGDYFYLNNMAINIGSLAAKKEWKGKTINEA